MISSRAIVACLVIVLSPIGALAQTSTESGGSSDTAASGARPPIVGRRTSLTFSPFHLIGPIVELTLERRVGQRAGMALVVGYGSLEGMRALEFGTQYRYYRIGDFEHGMILGGELLYARGTIRQGSIEGSSGALAIGPMIGYKVAFGFGLTLDLQAGAQGVLGSRRATNQMSGQSAGNSDLEIIPLLNVNIGATF